MENPAAKLERSTTRVVTSVIGLYQELTTVIRAKSPPASKRGETGLVSIIIATYDRPEQLTRLLRSIGQQIYTHIETIIVNDSPRTNLTKLTKVYPVERIIKTRKVGRGAASNKGFLKSRGEFVIFPDDDMELDPTMIMKLVDALARHPSRSYAYCGYRHIDGDHENTIGLTEFDPQRLVLNGNYINASSLIRKRKFIEVGMFDPTLKRLIDWDLWLSFLDRGEEGILVPEVLFKHIYAGGPRISDDANPRSLPYARALKVVEEKHSELMKFMLRTELSTTRQQNAQLQAELELIRSSFSYRVIRSFTSRIDHMCPDGTKRGALRKRTVLRLRAKTRDDIEGGY